MKFTLKALFCLVVIAGLFSFGALARAQFGGSGTGDPFGAPGLFTVNGTAVNLASGLTLGSASDPVDEIHVGDLYVNTSTITGVAVGNLMPDTDASRLIGNSLYRWLGLSIVSVTSTYSTSTNLYATNGTVNNLSFTNATGSGYVRAAGYMLPANNAYDLASALNSFHDGYGSGTFNWVNGKFAQMTISTSTALQDMGQIFLIQNTSSTINGTQGPYAGLTFKTGVTGLTSTDGVELFEGSGGAGIDFNIKNRENGRIYQWTNNTARWYVENTGEYTPVANNSYDIGKSTLSIKNLYASGTGTFGSGLQINQGTFTAGVVAVSSTGAVNLNGLGNTQTGDINLCISTSGTVRGAATCGSSSIRFKTIIDTYTPEELIKEARGLDSIVYVNKDVNDGKHAGFIAEQMARVNPLLVNWQETSEQGAQDEIKAAASIGVEAKYVVLREDGKIKIPEGVLYQNVGVLQNGAIRYLDTHQQEDEKLIKDLNDRVTKLEGGKPIVRGNNKGKWIFGGIIGVVVIVLGCIGISLYRFKNCSK